MINFEPIFASVELLADAVRKGRSEKPVLGVAFNWITCGKLTIVDIVA